MQFNKIIENPALDKSVAICLATFSMFIVGYSITRAYLSNPIVSNNSTQQETVVGHQGQMWHDLGK